MNASQTDIYPVHVAYQGLRHGLPLPWIFRAIEQGLRDGTVRPRTYLLWPGETPLSVRFTWKLLEGWKRQYDAGVRMEISQEVWDRIDWVLGFYRRAWSRAASDALPLPELSDGQNT